MENKKSSFSSSLGFVLAAAGSAVGLGNIWRFPYLAAKDGGGLFLLIYILVAVSFGFTMIVTEVAIGRRTKRSPAYAYGDIHPKFKWVGKLATIVPFLIFPYYCVIGGWVLKYAVTFMTGKAELSAQDDFFTGFITGQYEPIIYGAIFIIVTTLVVIFGVNNGIERVSKYIMPALAVMVIGIAVFSLTIKKDGVSSLDGLGVYLIPNLEGKGIGDIFGVIMDAVGQLFYSVSVAMGILVTYGSYLRDEDNLVSAVNQIEIFDTLVAFFAGLMIIPTVYVFMGPEGMTSGPGLMFIALPKIFLSMGSVFCYLIGVLFFLMVLFAALTSSVALMEAVVASLMEMFNISRKKATYIELGLGLAMAVVVCLGYNVFYFELELPNHVVGQILDLVDYITNNIMMPVVALATCLLIGWVKGTGYIIDEATKTGSKFNRKYLYIFMIRYVSPVLLLILLLMAFGILKF
ncbi:MAG: sodium-dependent transporter [Lachnospiraceae bacterium]|nr:sodium-dependent transporter [Lachnospiraceae bacterium]